MKKFFYSSFIVATLLVSSLFLSACQNSGPESTFLMTDDANNITVINEVQEMYRTDSSLGEVLSFYKENLIASGLKERELLTVQSDTTLNLVFDGSENGKALVIQAVVIEDYTNVTIRFEEI